MLGRDLVAAERIGSPIGTTYFNEVDGGGHFAATTSRWCRRWTDKRERWTYADGDRCDARR